MILLILTIGVLLFVAAVYPDRSNLSLFELNRRIEEGDKASEKILNRQKLLNDVVSLQKIIIALLLVITVLLANLAFGWLVGILVALLVALEYGVISQINFLKKIAKKYYEKIDDKLINFIQKHSFIFKLFRNVVIDDAERQINSRQELQYLVDKSEGILTIDEKKLIIHSLSFADQVVSSVMTPRSMIDSIKNSEFLGPLTLDELHKIGHSRLPVAKGDIDHIIGILNLRELLALDIKRSTTAEKAMDSKVYYIHQNQTLQHALAAFLKTRHHLFVVVNEFRETVGLLSLEDVLEVLLGREIIDEFDCHDNLRKVALRNPRENNHPKKSEDV